MPTMNILDVFEAHSNLSPARSEAISCLISARLSCVIAAPVTHMHDPVKGGIRYSSGGSCLALSQQART
eukprot:scaffold1832_cov362-Prasinococcus_capsulatus_cf.AAC.10